MRKKAVSIDDPDLWNKTLINLYPSVRLIAQYKNGKVHSMDAFDGKTKVGILNKDKGLLIK